jgi:hypothetical protein
MEERDRRTVMLTNVNTNIHGAVRDYVSSDDAWDFFCECGRADCQESVSLTIASYSALRGECGDGAVLAPGHDLSRAEQAQRKARSLRDDAAALRAQAEHQVKRAQKTRD